MDGEAVADRLTNTCEAEQREQREAMERSLTRDEERIEILDKMVMRLYEDMIAGRISEQNFNTMLEKTQTALRSCSERAGIPYEYLTGKTKDRQGAVERFNSSTSIPIFLISLKAVELVVFDYSPLFDV